MLTNVTETSRQAYAEHRASGLVTASQQKVLEVMRHGRDYSLSELSAMTGIEKSSVSGRINELKKLGQVVESRKRSCHVTGKTVTAVKKAVQ